MIVSDELRAIGYVAKTHGVKGELNIRLDTVYNPEDFRFLVFDMESIFVPFEVKTSRGNAADARLVQLEGVDNVDEARVFVGKTAYVLLQEIRNNPAYDGNEDEAENEFYLSDLVGFTLLDENGNKSGAITGFNDDTMNYLLEVELINGNKIFIPFVDEWLTDLDQENKTVSFDLPKGLIDIN